MERLLLVIGYAGIINGTVLALFLLWSKFGNIKSNRLLGAFIIAITLKISYGLTHATGSEESFQNFVFFCIAMAGYYAIGPLMWLYFKAVVDKQFRFNAYAFLHLIPSIYVLLTLTNRLPYFVLNVWVAQAQILVYIILAGIVLYRLKTSSKLISLRVEWPNLRNVMLGVALVWIIVVFLLKSDFNTIYALELAVLYSILFYVTVIATVKRIWENKQNEVPKEKAYTNSRLNDEKLNLIFDKLEAIMSEQAPYENSDINLQKIAKLVETTPHSLSETINRVKGVSFADYINTYRIEKAKTLLKEPDNVDTKIASIAYDCGFNALSTFNLAFKKLTETTPSKYRESVLN